MTIIDISVPCHEGMASFPGIEPPKFTQLRKLEEDGKSVWKFEMSTIAGTHIEAPCHSIAGAACIDAADLDKCFGPCEVIDVIGKDGIIQFTEVSKIKSPRVLFKTGNSSFIREDKFYDDYTALSLEAAETLVQNGVRLVGLDYYGIERRGSLDHPVHQTLLKAGVVILVGLDLSRVSPGYYTLSAMPLSLKGLDGSPCRAVLIQQ